MINYWGNYSMSLPSRTSPRGLLRPAMVAAWHAEWAMAYIDDFKRIEIHGDVKEFARIYEISQRHLLLAFGESSEPSNYPVKV